MPESSSHPSTFRKILQSLRTGVTYTAPTLPVMNGCFQTAKIAGATGVSSGRALSVMYSGSFRHLFQGLDILAGQQFVRLFGKSTFLGVVLPWAKEHYPGKEGLITAAGLTAWDMFLTPVETALTRAYTKQPRLPTLRRYYAATIPQGTRHGVIWFTYMATKRHVDALYQRFGINPDTRMGAFLTAPAVAAVVTLPMQPLYVIEAKRQAASVAEEAGRGLFKNLATGKSIFTQEGILGLYRGGSATVAGLSCLAVVANQLVLAGKRR